MYLPTTPISDNSATLVASTSLPNQLPFTSYEEQPTMTKKNVSTSIVSTRAGALPDSKTQSTARALIEANISVVALDEVRHQHIIPVFVKDNEPITSHGDFINATLDAMSDVFRGESILHPLARASHPIKGRIPERITLPISFRSEKRHFITNA